MTDNSFSFGQLLSQTSRDSYNELKQKFADSDEYKKLLKHIETECMIEAKQGKKEYIRPAWYWSDMTLELITEDLVDCYVEKINTTLRITWE